MYRSSGAILYHCCHVTLPAMSVRGVWIFHGSERKKGRVLFSRRFITVEKRQKVSEEKAKKSYFPLPDNRDLLKAVLKICCSEEDKVGVL